MRFHENFILPLSHDEVVHGKGSLIGKMPGDRWQRFANLRAYFGFMWGHPGKKLLFMGGEFAQEREWNHDRELDWPSLDDPAHAGVQRLVARPQPPLSRPSRRCISATAIRPAFNGRSATTASNSVFAFVRMAPGQPPVLVVCNMTPVPRHGYRIGVPHGGGWREIFNSDSGITAARMSATTGESRAAPSPRTASRIRSS